MTLKREIRTDLWEEVTFEQVLKKLGKIVPELKREHA